MRKIGMKESNSIRGGLDCPYCSWKVSGTSCYSKQARDRHIKAFHNPTHTVRKCS